MQRDLRETPLYQEIEAGFRRLAEPGFGQITGAGDVRSSPDGTSVAFRGARLDALEGQPSGRICVAAADGSGMRQVTHGPNEDSGPRWAPDGRTLTFLSDRATAGVAQLYALETGRAGRGAGAARGARRGRAPRVVAGRLPHPAARRRPGRRADRRTRLGHTRRRGRAFRIGFRWSSRARARGIAVARSTCWTSRAASSRPPRPST